MVDGEDIRKDKNQYHRSHLFLFPTLLNRVHMWCRQFGILWPTVQMHVQVTVGLHSLEPLTSNRHEEQGYRGQISS